MTAPRKSATKKAPAKKQPEAAKKRGPKTRVDWDGVKALWRTNTLSNQQIAKRFGCTEGAVRAKAKREGWQRDLADSVRTRIKEELVRADAESVRTSHAHANDSNNKPLSDDEIIAAAAQGPVEVVRQHRQDITQARQLAADLFHELRASTALREKIEEEIEEVTRDDKSPQRRSAMLRAVSLNGRTSALKDMSQAMRNFQTLERQAWNMDEGNKADDNDLSGLSDEALAAREAAIQAQLEAEGDGSGDD